MRVLEIGHVLFWGRSDLARGLHEMLAEVSMHVSFDVIIRQPSRADIILPCAFDIGHDRSLGEIVAQCRAFARERGGVIRRVDGGTSYASLLAAIRVSD